MKLGMLFWPYRRAVARADAARDRGDPAEAAILYRRVTERWPGRFGALVQLGNALKDSGAFKEADAVYGRALVIRPDDADCHLQRGHLMKLAGDYARAEQYYSDAHRLDPNRADAERELHAIRDAFVKEAPPSAPTLAIAPPLRAGVSEPANAVLRQFGLQFAWRRA